jgi:hypothetical protein
LHRKKAARVQLRGAQVEALAKQSAVLKARVAERKARFGDPPLRDRRPKTGTPGRPEHIKLMKHGDETAAARPAFPVLGTFHEPEAQPSMSISIADEVKKHGVGVSSPLTSGGNAGTM